MKNKILYNGLIALFLGLVISMLTGLNPFGSGSAVFLLGLAAADLPSASSKDMVYSGLQVEIWQNHIEEEIFKDNSFLAMSHRADDSVLNGVVVHIPQSGGGGKSIKNPQSFPLQVQQRIDSDVIYLLDQYAMLPVRVPLIDKAELSYDKRSSVLGERLDTLIEDTAEGMLFNWVNTPAYGQYSASQIPASHVFVVSGADGNGNADAPGAAGNRKMAALNDLQRMQTYFRSINRWKEGKMCALLTPNMLAEIAPADSVITATYMQSVTEEERRQGVYMKIQGWNIMSRSSVLSTDAGGSLRAPGEATEATDQGASLFWYKEAVETALGQIDALERLNDPEYLGDIYNWAVRIGGRCRRKDFKGVAILRQAA